MMDRYVFGEATRLSPEAPVPVVLAEREEDRPGGAANVAAGVAALGAEARLLCATGDDGAALDLKRLMEQQGVAMEAVRQPERRTTVKTRVLSGTQQIVRIDHDGRAGPEARAELIGRFADALPDVDVVLFSDYGKGVLDDLPAMNELARSAGLLTLVDPKNPDPAHYRGSFLLKPNETEFRALFGDCEDGLLVDAARAALIRHDIENIVLTRGPKGMLLIGRDGRVIDHPTRALEVFDVSGAGDTVIATLAVAIGHGLPLDEAIHVANVAAGVAVGRMGTHVVSLAELELALSEQGDGGSKLLDLEPLLRRLEAERARGRRIAFTNGCFDILHPGHVRMLAAARAEADLLVVGLNSDDSVRGLKGPTRPVNPFASRAEVLAGLASVDYVVGFGEPTPAALIERIAPDVLVKGGDYDPDQVVGARFVEERGGRLVLARFHEGHSSTAVIGRIAAGEG